MSSSSPPKITSKSTLPTSSPRKPWSHHLTLDTLLRVLRNTLLSPFIAWIIVLCLRAQVTPPTDPAWIIAVAYATALTLLFVAKVINHRVAHGIPRTVDSANEVVLVTGGASGLGLLVAQIYAMRGASVAVLDIRDIGSKEQDEVFGEDVRYFKCDVGNRTALEDVKEKIKEEVRLYVLYLVIWLHDQCFSIFCFLLGSMVANVCCSWVLQPSLSTVPRLESMAVHF
jgi:hypothetical protein